MSASTARSAAAPTSSGSSQRPRPDPARRQRRDRTERRVARRPRYLSNHSTAAILEERSTDGRRRCSSSPQPEQPTNLPTSYTTSWDLTRTQWRTSWNTPVTRIVRGNLENGKAWRSATHRRRPDVVSARVGCAATAPQTSGLSRRRSRVRVPSLPPLKIPANKYVALSYQTRRSRCGPILWPKRLVQNTWK